MDIYGEEQRAKIKYWRALRKRKDLKIGWCCSAFDLLHAGHMIMLRDAKEHCDVLLVGLQTDPTINRPSKNQPIQSLEERKIVLEGNKYIDDILLYQTEDDLDKILNILYPDIRILGTDWKDKKYTGYYLPIEIYWHERNHGYSTSELRQRIFLAERS